MIQYSEPVLDHFKHPRHIAVTHNPAAKTVQFGQKENGAVVAFYCELESDMIKSLQFKAYGCVATIASCSYVCDYLTGKAQKQAAEISSAMLMKDLELPQMKQHCAILISKVIHQLFDENEV